MMYFDPGLGNISKICSHWFHETCPNSTLELGFGFQGEELRIQDLKFLDLETRFTDCRDQDLRFYNWVFLVFPLPDLKNNFLHSRLERSNER